MSDATHRSALPRVLVIDDDATLSRMIRRVLGAGFDVTVAADGAEALGHMESGVPFDVILCDDNMPGMNGPTFCRALAARDPALLLRVVPMSGTGSSALWPAPLDEAGMCLAKPFSIEELRSLVRHFVASGRRPT